MKQFNKKFLKWLDSYSQEEKRSPEMKKVSTVDDYFSLPSSKRYESKFFGLVKWYKMPLSLRLNLDGKPDDQGWYGFKKRMAQFHPIQHFFRWGWRDSWIGESYYSICHFYDRAKEKYRKIKCRLYPVRPNLHKAVRYTWSDLVEIIPNVLFAGVVDFIEQEGCFKYVSWGEDFDETKPEEWEGEREYNRSEREIRLPIKQKLEEIYNWIKVEKPRQEKLLNEMTFETKEQLDLCNAKEKEIENKDTEYLKWIVEHRAYLWT